MPVQGPHQWLLRTTRQAERFELEDPLDSRIAFDTALSVLDFSKLGTAPETGSSVQDDLMSSDPRGKDPTFGVLREALGATAAPTKALSLRADKKPTYRICRREDGVDCITDVACTITKYFSAPLVLILFGHGWQPNPWQLVPSLTLAVCYVREKGLDAAIPDSPPKQNDGRSLTLKAPPIKPSPRALIRRGDNKPTYKICRREDGKGCVLDVSCWAVKYITTPLQLIMFGIWQFEQGPHMGPGHLVPVASILLCNKLQEKFHNEAGPDNPPKPKNGRSLTLEAPSIIPSPDLPRALLPRNDQKPTYTIYRRANSQACTMDAACFFIRYIEAPGMAVMFGIRQWQQGPHMAPVWLLPPISVLMCNKLEKHADSILGPEQTPRPARPNGRSVTVEAPPSDLLLSALQSRGDDVDGDAKGTIKYVICRRADGRGCWLDAACWTVKWVFSPIIVIILGATQIRLGPHVNPAVLIPPIWVLLCAKLQDRQDAEFDAESSTRKRSPPLTLTGPLTSSPPSALIPRDTEREREQGYTVCQTSVDKRCVIDASCWLLEHIGSPTFYFFWGIAQWRVGPRVGPGILLPPMSIALCWQYQQRNTETRALSLRSLDAPSLSCSPSTTSLSPRATPSKSDGKPTYTMCRADGRDYLIDATCFVIRYFLAPIMILLFGCAMMELGVSSFGPGFVLPSMLVKLCVEYQKKRQPDQQRRIRSPSPTPPTLDISITPIMHNQLAQRQSISPFTSSTSPLFIPPADPAPLTPASAREISPIQSSSLYDSNAQAYNALSSTTPAVSTPDTLSGIGVRGDGSSSGSGNHGEGFTGDASARKMRGRRDEDDYDVDSGRRLRRGLVKDAVWQPGYFSA
ncbi:MAG: hypothetical protein M1836_003307 [Candelina mexicana]|nr:MAG: hypothetical protein M1836_003307 [Candelina mexicana]